MVKKLYKNTILYGFVFFIKRGVGTVDIPDIEAFDCPTSDINNSPRPSILEDIPMPGMNIYNKEGT